MVVALMCLQQLIRLRQRLLRSAQVDVDAQQAFGHGPLENAPVPAALGLQGGFAHQLDDARFFPAFDDHQRHAGCEQGLQFSGGEMSAATGFHVRRTLAKRPIRGLVFMTTVTHSSP